MADLYHLYFDENMYHMPYKDTKEHIKDLLCVLDMYLYVIIVIKENTQEYEVYFRMRGISISNSEIMRSLEGSMIQNQGLELEEELTNPILQAWKHIENRSKISKEHQIELRFDVLCSKFFLSDFEQFCFLLAIACEYDRKYEKLFEVIQGTTKVPTKGLAISLYELIEHLEEEELVEVLNNTSYLFEYLLLKEEKNEIQLSKLSEVLCVKKRILDYLRSNDTILEELTEFVEYFDSRHSYPQSSILKEKIIKVCQVVDRVNTEKENVLINIFGEKGIGKKLVVKNVAKIFGFSVLFVDLEELLKKEKVQVLYDMKQIIVEAVLKEAILCFHNVGIPSEMKLLEDVLKLADKKFQFLFLLSEERMKHYDSLSKDKISIEIEPPSITDRIVLWEEIIQDFSVAEDVDIHLNANKYNFNALGIRNVLNTAKLHSYYENRTCITQEDIVFSVKQQTVNQLGEYATLINAVFTWDDLIIDEEQKYQIQMFCNQIKYRNLVEEEWGFKEKLPYGKGLCAMFYGAPGTGKTMVVQVIANELGMDLYRVDLSQMISKYIGETEKNITNLFKKAKNINALLFFDEADALFAKRSEVQDSHDRNANTETAHLLQKLEEYDGISILATNYINNIDEAFKRRIKFIVNFSFPTKEVRYHLWTSMLPKKAKVKEDIDFRFFANQFELSGSNIKEILLNAAYIAVSKQKPISNRHIIEAIRYHFMKQGKLLLKEDLGEYGDLFY